MRAHALRAQITETKELIEGGPLRLARLEGALDEVEESIRRKADGMSYH